MKRSRKRTVSSEVGLATSRLLTPCRRLGLTARRTSLLVSPRHPLPSSASPSVPEPATPPVPTQSSPPAPAPSPSVTVASSSVQQVVSPIPLLQRSVSVLSKKPAVLSVNTPAPTLPIALSDEDNEPLSTFKAVTTKTVRKKKERKPKSDKKKEKPITLSQKTVSSSLPSDSDDDFQIKTSDKKRKLSRAPSSSGSLSKSQTKSSISTEIEEIKSRIKTKKEIIEKLKITNQHDDTILKASIIQWRTACQEALKELLNINKRKRSDKVNMEELLNLLHIPCDLIRYDPEQMNFI